MGDATPRRGTADPHMHSSVSDGLYSASGILEWGEYRTFLNVTSSVDHGDVQLLLQGGGLPPRQAGCSVSRQRGRAVRSL